MTLFAYIDWNVSPEIFSIGPVSIRYYSLFFALSFWLGFLMMERIFKFEKAPEAWLDKLFMYMVVATIVGARLGHVFFYGWDHYSQHPEDILKVWEGGLASHGGAIGILIAIYIYSKKITKRSPLWVLDRVVVPVALAAFFIRMGNLMNSEIVGSPTDVPWAFRFLRLSAIDNPELPRHPSQLYEALFYLLVFVMLFWAYWKKEAGRYEGRIFGWFLIGIFGFRLLIETIKENQEAFEQGMILNMGQILSIPFVVAGVYFIWRSRTKKDVVYRK